MYQKIAFLPYFVETNGLRNVEIEGRQYCQYVWRRCSRADHRKQCGKLLEQREFYSASFIIATSFDGAYKSQNVWHGTAINLATAFDNIHTFHSEWFWWRLNVHACLILNCRFKCSNPAQMDVTAVLQPVCGMPNFFINWFRHTSRHWFVLQIVPKIKRSTMYNLYSQASQDSLSSHFVC